MLIGEGQRCDSPKIHYLFAVVFSGDHQLLTASSLWYFLALYGFSLSIISSSAIFPHNTDFTINSMYFHFIRPTNLFDMRPTYVNIPILKFSHLLIQWGSVI